MKRVTSSGGTRRAGRRGVLFTCLALSFAARAAGATADLPGAVVLPGVAHEHALAPDGVDSWWFDAAPGQFLSLRVEPERLALVVTLANRSGAVLARAEDTTGDTPVRLSAVADAYGPFEVKVAGAGSRGADGRYRLLVAELHAASQADRRRADADKLHAEAARLAVQGDADAQRAALERYGEVRERWRGLGDQQREADTLLAMVDLRFDLGEPREGVALAHEAAGLYETIGDRRGQATALNSLGSLEWRLGNLARALDYHERALPVAMELPFVRLQAVILNNIGTVHQALGNARLALEYYGRALPLRRRAGDQHGIFGTLANIGVARRMLGENDRALAAYQDALPLARSSGNARDESLILQHLGALALAMGDPKRAADRLERARELSRGVGDRRGEAYAVGLLGMARRLTGDRDLTLSLLSQARDAYRALGDRYWEAFLLRQRASVLRELGRLQDARDQLAEALDLQRAVGDRFGETNSLLELGLEQQASGASAAARQTLSQVLAVARATDNLPAQAGALFHLAQLRREAGELDGALQDAQAAVALQESLRARVSGSDWRATFFVSAQALYEFEIDLLMSPAAAAAAEGPTWRALEASERKRARALLDSLVESKAQIAGDADPELRRRESELEDRLRVLVQRLDRLRARAHDAEEADNLTREVREVSEQAAGAARELQASSPVYAALLQGTVAGADAVQKLLDDDTVLLEFSLGDEASYAWAVTRERIDGVRLAARAELVRAGRDAWTVLGTAPGARPRAHARPAAAALTLSRMLLGPLVDKLERRRIVIVADGILQHVPFAALPEPAGGPHAGRPLALDHTLALLPSASILKALRERAQPARPPKAVAVLADPVFESDDPRLARGLRSGEASALDSQALRVARDAGLLGTSSGLPRLPFSRREARSITGLAARGAVLSALDFEASRATALSPRLRDYRILHFATHALVDNEHPERSGIVLSLFDPGGREQDGYLRLTDVSNLRLPAELVVLSACRTAVGKELRGEGLMSLVRAFMYAGTPRVVASLWNVDDQATAALMGEFYRGPAVGAPASRRGPAPSPARDPLTGTLA